MQTLDSVEAYSVDSVLAMAFDDPQRMADFHDTGISGTDFRAYELYDHQSDPDENINLAVTAEHKRLVDELKKKLHAGWKAAVP